MAADRIKDITVEIGGDTTKLQTALKGVNSEIKNTQWCCTIKVDTLFSRILIYNHNQYENGRKKLWHQLYVLLGHEKFTELFPVIVTDRGSEFTGPLDIEFNGNGERRTRVFYCDPQHSDQKGGCEVCHEMIRRVLPKKSSFDNLIQEDVSLLMSHINSYTRKKLNDQSANQLFSFLYGEDTLAKLGIKVIPANEINLTPYLLKK